MVYSIPPHAHNGTATSCTSQYSMSNDDYYLVTVSDHCKKKPLAVFDYCLNALQLTNSLQTFTNKNVKVFYEKIPINTEFSKQNDEEICFIENQKFFINSKYNLNVLINSLNFTDVSHYFNYKLP